MAIRTTDLTRRFETVTAVAGLSLEIAAGTIFGFLGPNGAGKTTTIRLLLGLIEPSSGTAEVLGLDVATAGGEVRRSSGVLLEHHGLYERLSAQDNLAYFARLWHLDSRDRQRRISELLDHFGLAERRSDVVGGWSRGMKQKLAIARALLHRPRLVFLDEPTAGLDPVASVSLRNDLAALAQREGTTVFITTHNLDEAQRLCDQVGVINLGRLVAVGSPDSLRQGGGQRVEILGRGFRPELIDGLRSDPSVESVEASAGRVLMALEAGRSVAPLVRMLVDGGADIEEIIRGAPSLESAFLALLAPDEAEFPDQTEGLAGGLWGA